jgi:hypothetical protein
MDINVMDETASAFVLHPGDKLIVVTEAMDIQRADALTDQLERQLGVGNVLLLVGPRDVYVQRPS